MPPTTSILDNYLEELETQQSRMQSIRQEFMDKWYALRDVPLTGLMSKHRVYCPMREDIDGFLSKRYPPAYDDLCVRQDRGLVWEKTEFGYQNPHSEKLIYIPLGPMTAKMLIGLQDWLLQNASIVLFDILRDCGNPASLDSCEAIADAADAEWRHIRGLKSKVEGYFK